VNPTEPTATRAPAATASRHYSVSRRLTARFAASALLFSTLLAPASAQDPEAAASAQALAGQYHLTNADGDRVCALTLEARSQSGNDTSPTFGLDFDKQACAPSILFSPDIAHWSPAPGNAIRLLRADGRLVAEFTEGVDGTWEALREGDGVYFLVNPKLAAAAQILPEQVFGTWDLARTAGRPACRIRFSDAPIRPDAYRLDPDPNCGLLFGRSSIPVRWRIDHGTLSLETTSGARLNFSLDVDGGWTKVPEDGRPLFLSRVP